MKLTARDVLGLMIAILSYTILILLMFFPLPANNKDTFQMLISSVVGISIGGVIGYNYGNSKKEPALPGTSTTDVTSTVTTDSTVSNKLTNN